LLRFARNDSFKASFFIADVVIARSAQRDEAISATWERAQFKLKIL
jgi:hypothetical protein